MKISMVGGALICFCLTLFTTPAEAIPLRVCKQTCSTNLAQDCAGLRRGRFARCKQRVWRQCKRGLISCPLPTTTTTLPVGVTTTTIKLGTPTTTTAPTTLRPTTTTTTSTTTTTLTPLVSDYIDSYEFSGERLTNSCTATFGLPQFFFVTWSVQSYFNQNLFGIAYDHPTSYFFANTMQGVATYPDWAMTSQQCELESVGLVWCASVQLAMRGLPDFGEQVAGAMTFSFTFFDGRPDCVMGYAGNVTN